MLAAMKVRGMAIYGIALADARPATPCRAPGSGVEHRHRGLQRRRQPARRRVRRQRRPRLQREPDPRRRRARVPTRTSCCSPASPACAPARSRWPPANTFRCGRSASSSSTRSRSSATSSTNIRKPRRRSWRSSTPRRACRTSEATKLAQRTRRRSGARARHAGARGAGPQSRRAGLARGARRSLVRCRSRSGALLPLAPFMLLSGTARAAGRDRRHRGRAVRRRRACCRCSPAAARCASGLRMLALGALAGAVTFAIGRLVGVTSLEGATAARSTAQSLARRAKSAPSPRPMPAGDGPASSWHPGARSRCGSAIPGFSPARSRASTATPAVRGHRRPCVAADGAFLAQAAYSPASQIRARVWTFDSRRDASTPRSSRGASRAQWRRARALLDARPHGGAASSTASPTACPASSPTATATSSCCSCLSAGAERWRDVIAAALADATGVRCVYERSDAEVRTLEGLPPRTGVAARRAAGRRDDRRGRARLPRRRRAAARRPASTSTSATTARIVRALAAGRRVLNAFCYTGGFTLAALAGGAASRALDRQLRPTRSPSRARTSRAIRRCDADARAVARGGRVRGAAQVARRAARRST